MKRTIVIVLFLSASAYATGLKVTWEPFVHPDCDPDNPNPQVCTAGYNLYRATPNLDSPAIKLNLEGELITQTEIDEHGQVKVFWIDETVWGWARYYYIAEAISIADEILSVSNPQCIVHACHGDVNESYTITVSDAAMIAQYLVGLIELSGNALKAADANIDGDVTISDAARIHLHIVGLMSLEHCP